MPSIDKKSENRSKETKNSLKNSSKIDQKHDKKQPINGEQDKFDLSNCAGCGKPLNKPVSILHQPRSTSRQSGRSVQIQLDRPESPLIDNAATAATATTTLFALNRHWHESCFRCSTCETLLFNKEYMTSKLELDAKLKESSNTQNKLIDSPEHQMQAHCMTCYKNKLSVRCSYCSRIIEGKVLQAGDLHFHPTCCRCFKCGFL